MRSVHCDDGDNDGDGDDGDDGDDNLLRRPSFYNSADLDLLSR
jgi:hypothetical protein